MTGLFKRNLNFKSFMLAYWLQTVISAAVGLILFVYVFYSETGELPDEITNWKYIITVILLSNLLAYLFKRFSQHLNRFYSWRNNITLRLFWGILGKYAIVLVVLMVTLFIYLKLGEFGGGISGFWAMHYDPAVKVLLLTFITVFIHSIANFTLYSYNEYAVGQIESLRLERKHFELQFEALKSQISPHYLFNCFNTISSLVYQSPVAAETFIRRLVQTYQYILDTKNRKLVSIAEEIEFVRAYNYLLKVRFENALNVKIDLPDDKLQTRLPPMTLQMLVENAVKHNVVSDDMPLEVSIAGNGAQGIIVSNNKNKRSLNGRSHAIGLENIRKRYQYFTATPIRIVNSDKFEVMLPFLYH